MSCTLVSNCQTCPNGQCTQCNDFYHLTTVGNATTCLPNGCSPMPANCAECFAQKCTQCSGGYHLKGGDCVPNCPGLSHCATCELDLTPPRCLTCMPNYFPLPDHSGCVATPQCGIPNCSKCDPNSLTNCIQCSSGFKLKDGECNRKLPIWFWITVGCVSGLVLIVIFYAIFHKGESQEVWAAKMRKKFSQSPPPS